MLGVLLSAHAIVLLLFYYCTCDCIFAAVFLPEPLPEPQPAVPLLAPVPVLLQLVPQPEFAPKFVLLGTSAGACT